MKLLRVFTTEVTAVVVDTSPYRLQYGIRHGDNNALDAWRFLRFQPAYTDSHAAKIPRCSKRIHARNVCMCLTPFNTTAVVTQVSLGRANPSYHVTCPSKGGGEASQVAELLALSEDEKLELGQAVLRAVLQKEEALRAAIGKSGDYTKSFSGTKQDTQVSITGPFRVEGTSFT